MLSSELLLMSLLLLSPSLSIVERDREFSDSSVRQRMRQPPPFFPRVAAVLSSMPPSVRPPPSNRQFNHNLAISYGGLPSVGLAPLLERLDGTENAIGSSP